jgi:general secretion pathway protein G
MNRRRQAFTLIELLVVVTIITILAAVVAVNLFQEPGKAKRAAARAQIVAFRTALKIYGMDNGALPTQAQGLRALVEKPATPPIPATYPADGYLESRQVPRDPWDHEYVYLVPGSRGETMEILSYGKDGKPGGEGEDADISSSNL